MISRRWIWFSACALLFAGVTNAHSHIHYCFDGHEPTHAIPAHHAHDAAGDHDPLDTDHDHDPDHDDVDVDVPNHALAKSVAHDSPAVVATWLWTAQVAAAAGAVGSPPHTIEPAPNPPYSRPEPRGPPR